MSTSAGSLIWISCRPLIRLAAGVAAGYAITKADIFPPVASRGAGQIALNITLPSLLFSKLVPAFTKENVKAIGPLVFVALLYEGLGILLAWVITKFCWVPHRFRYGILIAGGWGNVGDVSTAVLLSLTQNAPFQGTADQNLAVAYISVFILVFIITLFPLGAYRLLAWDFIGPDVEPQIVQAEIKARRERVLRFFMLKRRQEYPQSPSPVVMDVERDEEKAISTEPAAGSAPLSRQGSTHDDVTTIVTQGADGTKNTDSTQVAEDIATPPKPPRSFSRYGRLAITYVVGFIKGVLNPISIAIFASLPISLVPELKALFVEVPGVNMPPAPDGQPPLAFIQDIATFIGGASIPIGLICLGSSLARLNVPMKQWRTLPIGAISWMAVGKLIIMPVLGVLICKGLVQSGVLFKDDKVLIFIAIFFSCLPTATTQVYMTQVYSGTGTAEHLSAFLIPQYILMFISMSALNVYAIHTIF